jgi:glycine betaine/proline transport system substrate-binding protein
MNLFKKLTATVAVLTLTFSLAACAGGDDDEIILSAGDWESVQIHNEIAMYIMDHGYDQAAEQVIADTPAQVSALRNGSFQVLTEMWAANVSTYNADIAAGEYHEVSVNFIDPGQGLYIPKYLQDSEDIDTLQDLEDKSDLFQHPEATGDKGLVFGGPEGWAATDFFNTKFSNEGDYPELSENFEFYPMGSTAVLNQRLQQAYDNEEPWVGYHWAPTWPHAVMDLVFLKDDLDYVAEDHETRAVGDLPTGDVTVVVTDGFEEDYPEIFDFFSNYSTSTTITSAVINYAQGEGIENRDAAIWFLNEYEDVWTEWVPQNIEDKVLDALASE